MPLKTPLSLTIVTLLMACELTQVSEEPSEKKEISSEVIQSSQGSSSQHISSERIVTLSSQLTSSSAMRLSSEEVPSKTNSWGEKQTIRLTEPSKIHSIDLDNERFEIKDSLNRLTPFSDKNLWGSFDQGLSISWNNFDTQEVCSPSSEPTFYSNFTSISEEEFNSLDVIQALSKLAQNGSDAAIDLTGFGLFIDAQNRIIKMALYPIFSEAEIIYFIGPKAEALPSKEFKNYLCSYTNSPNSADTSKFIPRENQIKPTFIAKDNFSPTDSIPCEGYAIRQISLPKGVHPISANTPYQFSFELKVKTDKEDHDVFFNYAGVQGMITKQGDTLWAETPDKRGEDTKGKNTFVASDWTYGQFNNTIYQHDITWDQQKYPLAQMDKIIYGLGGECFIPIPKI